MATSVCMFLCLYIFVCAFVFLCLCSCVFVFACHFIVYFRILEEDISKYTTCISLRLQVASHLDVQDKYATRLRSPGSFRFRTAYVSDRQLQ